MKHIYLFKIYENDFLKMGDGDLLAQELSPAMGTALVV